MRRLRDRVLDFWDHIHHNSPGPWLYVPLATACLGIGAIGGITYGHPDATVYTAEVKGRVITVHGHKRIRVPGKTVYRKGKVVVLPARTIPFTGTPTVVTRDGLSFVRITSTIFDTKTKKITLPNSTIIVTSTLPGSITTLPGTTDTVFSTIFSTVTEPGTTVTVTFPGPTT